MTTGQSAKIYQFPARGRFGSGASRDNVQSPAGLATQRAAITACGSAWYHDEAIEEADRKN